MEEERETAFDPARRLCPDGACVGVIGPDGRCTACARTEAEAAAGLEVAEAPSGGAAPSGGESGSGGFEPGRRLCDDGACVGVIGPDGACAVCGRRAQ